MLRQTICGTAEGNWRLFWCQNFAQWQSFVTLLSELAVPICHLTEVKWSTNLRSLCLNTLLWGNFCNSSTGHLKVNL